MTSVSPHQRPRLLIFVPSYQAERHIQSVIDRIPRDLGDGYDAEVCVFDDASTDGTVAAATAAFELADLPYPCRVLSNSRNQGYGGNQKLGYRYARNAGFDVVVMVHGDGQYPPEDIAQLAECALTNGAAFGSRFGTKRGALKGGMPKYKFVGNRILTGLQNRLLGTGLTEFHSGFRAYRGDLLSSIPFELNSNDFHFDTEIFIQIARAGYGIGEIAITTHYGDEECRVDGLSYAGNVVSQSLRSRLHDLGLFYERKFDVDTDRDASIYEAKVDFTSPTTAALRQIPWGSVVLDLGGSDGHLAAELKKKGCTVVGVDLACPADESNFDRFIQHNLDDGLPEITEDVDVVVMLDVIEHLRSPEDFVAELGRFCVDNGVQSTFVSTGNVAFVAQRLMLLLGQFNYGPRGILDMTHTRLFTRRTIARLFRQAGFDVLSNSGIPVPFPLAVGDAKVGNVLFALNEVGIKLAPRLCSFQFFLELRSPADLDRLIRESQVHNSASVDASPAGAAGVDRSISKRPGRAAVGTDDHRGGDTAGGPAKRSKNRKARRRNIGREAA